MLTYLIKIYYTLEIVTPSSPSRAISSKMFPGMFSGNSIFKIQNLSVVVVGLPLPNPKYFCRLLDKTWQRCHFLNLLSMLCIAALHWALHPLCMLKKNTERKPLNARESHRELSNWPWIILELLLIDLILFWIILILWLWPKPWPELWSMNRPKEKLKYQVKYRRSSSTVNTHLAHI